MKEKITLLTVQLLFKYYKKDITDLYALNTDNIVLDNDVLNNLNERLYITTFDKYIDLQKRVDKAKVFCDKQKQKMYKNRNKIALFILLKLEKIINGTIGE